MDDSLPSLSEMQWEVMRALWELGESSVSEVWQHLCETRPVARNTVLTQLDRLVRKGWVNRREVRRMHRYRAVRSEDSTRREHLRRWIESAFEGAADQLVLALLDDEVLTPDDIQRIQQKINQARRKKS